YPGRSSPLERPRPDLADRIAFRAETGDLVLAAVYRRVRHGVAPIAIGQHFEVIAAFAGARPFDSAPRGIKDHAHVHSVDLLARNVEGGAAAREIGRRGSALDRGAHGVFVILDDVD